MDSLLNPTVESTYLNIDICKFESSQNMKAQQESADSLKANRKPRAFNCGG